MKKLFIALAAIALIIQAFLVFPAFAARSSYILGDADGDGSITIRDATKVQMVLADLEEDNDRMVAMRTDFYRNGLTINCATTIQKYLVHLPVDCDIGKVICIEGPTTEQTTTAQPTTIAPTTMVQMTTNLYELPFLPVEN